MKIGDILTNKDGRQGMLIATQIHNGTNENWVAYKIAGNNGYADIGTLKLEGWVILDEQENNDRLFLNGKEYRLLEV